jgi:hypothetical protein
VMNLVGDLATFRPGGKVVFLEGENSEFDLRFVSTLFPAFAQEVNLVSGGSRQRVADLQAVFEAAEKAGISARFYAITDRDSSWQGSERDAPRRSMWDVYHVENYLIAPKYILRVLQELNIASGRFATEADVLAALQTEASATVNEVLTHVLRQKVNSHLVSALDLRVSPEAVDVSAEFCRAIRTSIERVNTLAVSRLEESQVREEVSEVRRGLHAALSDGQWVLRFPGRSILRRFAGHLNLKYEYLRDLLLARMRDDSYQPEGAARVIEQIRADS